VKTTLVIGAQAVDHRLAAEPSPSSASPAKATSQSRSPVKGSVPTTAAKRRAVDVISCAGVRLTPSDRPVRGVATPCVVAAGIPCVVAAGIPACPAVAPEAAVEPVGLLDWTDAWSVRSGAAAAAAAVEVPGPAAAVDVPGPVPEPTCTVPVEPELDCEPEPRT
jgi:hypothetical protein